MSTSEQIKVKFIKQLFYTSIMLYHDKGSAWSRAKPNDNMSRRFVPPIIANVNQITIITELPQRYQALPL
jgi:hypothetical protein